MSSAPTAAPLCLNMIVRNEARIIERCLRSVADHISCWVICDTGSDDDTMRIITDFFRERNIPGELHQFPFVDFEHSRNQAMDRAFESPLAYDYLLFTDADMELVVLDPDFRAGLTANGYTVQQKSKISYWNARLARRGSNARYRGVTHEYLEVPGGTERLSGIRFNDYAEGSSRKEKYSRDIALLERDIAAHPEHKRSWFYLAQSYRETKQFDKAIPAYRQRIELGGWAEEKWYARMQLARCLRKSGDDAGFIQEALLAWNERPHRAEPLYDLARYHRDKGLHAASVLFAEQGMRLPFPQKDGLFVEDWVYDYSLKEEYAICGYYVPEHREPGGIICNALALAPNIPQPVRVQARRNLKFYAQPLEKSLKSFHAWRCEFQPPAGFHAMNPSVVRRGDELFMVQRTVNYELTKAGQYVTPDDGPVLNRNFLLQLDATCAIKAVAEILPPADLPPPVFERARGFCDLRPFFWKGEFWVTATFREQTAEGWCDNMLCRLEQAGRDVRLTDCRVLKPEGKRQHEKNWMVASEGEDIFFFYAIAPTRIVNSEAATIATHPTPWMAEQLRGSSQAIPFASGWLAISHEHVATGKARYYTHRFVWFDKEKKLRRLSLPFTLVRPGVEFVAGLAWHPDGKRLIASFGVGDAESWLATFDATEAAALLAAQSPSEPVIRQ